MKFAVVLACVIAGAMADDPSFDDCGGSTSVMKVVAAGTEPAAVQKAMDFNITWTGDLPAAVTGGNVHQKMWEKVLGAWIPAPHTFDHDICELNACPLAPGNQTPFKFLDKFLNFGSCWVWEATLIYLTFKCIL